MSTTTKRKRGGKAKDAFRFAQLPTELQKTIIELACRLPPLPCSAKYVSTYDEHLRLDNAASLEDVRPWEAIERARAARPKHLAVDLDTPTALNLTLVSRAVYSQVVVVLYRHPHLSRPSVLQAFHSTLTSRPGLGLYVRSLHLGPAYRGPSDLNSDWWAVQSVGNMAGVLGGATPHLKASLTGLKDGDLIPKWCTGTSQFPLRGAPYPPDCRGLAISQALTAIQQSLDIDLCRQDFSPSGEDIGLTLYHPRVFEAQAALNLFLAAMRRCEDGSSDYAGSWRIKSSSSREEGRAPPACLNGTCGHYPPLELAGTVMPPQRRRAKKATGSQAPLVISRSNILLHLTRPGGQTDRFDHELLFLRSGDAYLSTRGNGRVGVNNHGALHAPAAESDSVSGNASTPFTGNIDVALPNTASVSSLLALARSVLSFAPNVVNLSVSGIFERVISSERPPPELRSLQALSIGPPPPQWRKPLCFSIAALATVKKLRVVGVMLFEEEVRSVSSLFAEGKLEKFEWVMGACFSQRHSPSLEQIIEGLLQDGSPEPEAAASSSTFGQSTDLDAAKSHPLIEVKLHPDDVTAFLSRAPSQEVRTAWSRGLPLSSKSRRLLLGESKAATRGLTRGDMGKISRACEVLHEEGRHWWGDQAQG